MFFREESGSRSVPPLPTETFAMSLPLCRSVRFALAIALLLGSTVAAQSAGIIDALFGGRGGGGGAGFGAQDGDQIAAVIRAQGQFMLDNQKALLMREEVRAKRMENRRKQLEQWMWERENLPTLQDEREKAQRLTLQHARNTAPLTEIWSAKALNDLLAHAKQLSSAGNPAADFPLNSELLAKIHVTSGKGNLNVGLIKGGKIPWPILLKRSLFASNRERLNKFVELLLTEVNADALDPDTIDEIYKLLKALEQQLIELARSKDPSVHFTPAQFIEARRCLSQLEDAIKALEEPGAINYLNGKFAAKGNSIGELVTYMRENGLQFAPATPGSYEAYAALYQALRDYDIAGDPDAARR